MPLQRRTFTFFALAGFASLAMAASPRMVVAVELAVPLRSADWIAVEVAGPFERAFAMLPGLVSMRSVSSGSRCLIELGYAGSPMPDALIEVRSVAEATWRALNGATLEPSITIRAALLS